MMIDDQELDEETFAHFELLADAFFENLQRGDTEFGGWGLDNKRPFGNSTVEPDLAEIVYQDRDKIWDEEGEYDEDIQAYLFWLYDNLAEFLQKRWAELHDKSQTE